MGLFSQVRRACSRAAEWTPSPGRVPVRWQPRIRLREFDPYRPVQIAIPSGEQYVSEVRGLIERVSIPTWLTTDEVAELKLAATEACLNAIRHGSPRGSGDTVGIRIQPSMDQVVVEVRDRGRGFDERQARSRPPSTGESGRGLRLIDSLVDHVEHRHGIRGHVVRILKRSHEVPLLRWQ